MIPTDASQRGAGSRSPVSDSDSAWLLCTLAGVAFTGRQHGGISDQRGHRGYREWSLSSRQQSEVPRRWSVDTPPLLWVVLAPVPPRLPRV